MTTWLAVHSLSAHRTGTGRHLGCCSEAQINGYSTRLDYGTRPGPPVEALRIGPPGLERRPDKHFFVTAQCSRNVELSERTSRGPGFDSGDVKYARIQFESDQPIREVASSGLLKALMRYARSRLHDVSMAEDAVSETLLATLESDREFDSPAQQVAWMFGVLRHKLVDQLRQQARETPSGDLAADAWAVDPGDAYPLGVWPCAGDAGSNPEQACHQKQFIERVARSCDALPLLHRQAFVMRELLDMDPAGICTTLGVSEGHLWVLVHRARLRLRESLSDAMPALHDPTPRAARVCRVNTPTHSEG